MSTLSSADLIEEDDKLIEVKIVLYATVNRSAYEREYETTSGHDLKEDIRSLIYGAVETGFVYGGSYPEGIVLNVNL